MRRARQPRTCAREATNVSDVHKIVFILSVRCPAERANTTTRATKRGRAHPGERRCAG